MLAIIGIFSKPLAMNCPPWSRLERFFALGPEGRRLLLQRLPLKLEAHDFACLDQALPLAIADSMSENVIGTMSLPFSVAANFVIDDEPVLIPMVTEEPSIVAAVSKLAKITARASGFCTTVDAPLLKGQLQLYGFSDSDKIACCLQNLKPMLVAHLNSLIPSMLKRGGGVVDLSWRALSSRVGPMLLIEAMVDVRDAMGANIVNTLMEELKEKLAPVLESKIGLAILSNLCDQRLARARCLIPYALLSSDATHDDGRAIAEKILFAHAFAEADVYRACTHNKGVLNGVDAVALATGNDFRAIEAAAHAYAARNGSYAPLTTLSLSEQGICAELIMPLAVGVVGGNCAIHPSVKLAHKLLGTFAHSGQGLAKAMVSVGLAQCLAALLALSHEGIQKGHMKLHKKKLLLKKSFPT